MLLVWVCLLFLHTLAIGLLCDKSAGGMAKMTARWGGLGFILFYHSRVRGSLACSSLQILTCAVFQEKLSFDVQLVWVGGWVLCVVFFLKNSFTLQWTQWSLHVWVILFSGWLCGLVHGPSMHQLCMFLGQWTWSGLQSIITGTATLLSTPDTSAELRVSYRVFSFRGTSVGMAHHFFCKNSASAEGWSHTSSPPAVLYTLKLVR